jgi:ABC-2 type transport system permease protein
MKMKKFLNKGLIYNWFNSAKVPIIIGLIAWGFIADAIIRSEMTQVKFRISDSFVNDFATTNLDQYLGLGIIFVAIYFIAQGINKRNAAMFLASGPYTKKQIKYNELMCIFATLTLFVITYLYIALMAYFRNKQLLSIVDGYWYIIFIEVAKIILIGAVGILFMLTVDLLFSNTVVGFASMIFVIPASIVLIITKVSKILEYTGIDNRYMVNYVEDQIPNYNVLIDKATSREIRLRELFFEIVIALCLIAIMLIIYNLVQKRYRLECCNKIFSSKVNENIIVVLISLAIGSLGSLILASDFIRNMQFLNGGDYLPLYGTNLIKALSLDLLCITIVGGIAYKIMKKVLRSVV